MSGPPRRRKELVSPIPATSVALLALEISPVGSSSITLIDMLGPRSSCGLQTTLPKPVALALSVRQIPPLVQATQIVSPAPGEAGVPGPPEVPGIGGVVGTIAGNTANVWIAPCTGLSGMPSVWPP